MILVECWCRQSGRNIGKPNSGARTHDHAFPGYLPYISVKVQIYVNTGTIKDISRDFSVDYFKLPSVKKGSTQSTQNFISLKLLHSFCNGRFGKKS